MLIALVIVGIGTVVLLTAAPFLLPWPQRLRWLLVTTSAPLDPWGLGSGVPPSTRLDAVTITRVDPFLEVGVEVVSSTTERAEWLRYPAATLTGLARLERWAVAGTPLLLLSDSAGAVSLHGPDVAVQGLHAGQLGIRNLADPRAVPSPGEFSGGDHGRLGLTPLAPQGRGQ